MRRGSNQDTTLYKVCIVRRCKVRGIPRKIGETISLPLRDALGIVGREKARHVQASTVTVGQPPYHVHTVPEWGWDEWSTYLDHALATRQFTAAKARAKDVLGVTASSWVGLETAIKEALGVV